MNDKKTHWWLCTDEEALKSRGEFIPERKAPRRIYQKQYYLRVKSGSRKLYRWFMEEMLGRPLRSDEDVHHINGDGLDNRPENLTVMPHSEHFKLHHSQRAARKHQNVDGDGRGSKYE